MAEQSAQNITEDLDRFSLALEASLDGFWEWDRAAGQTHYSPRWQAIAGFEPHEHVDTLEHWLSRVHHEDHPRLEADLRALRAGKARKICNEHRLRDERGTWRWVMVRGVARYGVDGSLARLAGSMTDITERKTTDPLTGLPNRLFFADFLERRLARARQGAGWEFVLLAMEIEQFMLLNESFGYSGGDTLLLETAQRLVAVTAKLGAAVSPLVARQGSAEFLVCVEGVADEQHAIEMANSIYADLRLPFQWRSKRILPRMAMGLVIACEECAHPEDLMQAAELALIEAKEIGCGPLVCYSNSLRERVLARLQLESDLEQAIQTGQMVFHYQPEIDLVSGRIVGFEALVRWQHPVRGLLGPREFVPIAEQTSLILPLGDWGLTEACRQIMAWREMEHADRIPLRVSVNLSARQFGQPGLVGRVAEILANSAMKPDHLRIEVTESSLMGDADTALKTMQDLQSLGVGLHMDDFGTGYSSLNYLHRFPFDTLKIDRSFIQGIVNERDSVEIVRTILELARSLNMAVVAEGIETPQQAECLRSLGCQYGQGYFFARPMTAEAVGAMLARAGEWQPPSYMS
jgi:diguanylate cyclase (GGDEF)-like protein/PAS domain S-box-containing protein